ALAGNIHVETEQAHHVPVIEPRGESVLAVEQGTGIRVFGEVVAEGLQCDEGFGVAELFTQQVAGAIDRPHAADAEQALDPVAAAQHLRQLARCLARRFAYGLPGRSGGQGEVGEITGFGDFAHRRITTALRLSRAGPSSTRWNRRSTARCGEGRLRQAPSSSADTPW